jgi:hypothetical protein
MSQCRNNWMALASSAFVFFAACGGSVGSGTSDASIADGSNDDSGGDGDAALSPCESTMGLALCGGSLDCPNTAACNCAPRFCDAGAAICLNDAAVGLHAPTCFLCPDGDVCVEEEPLCGVDSSVALGSCYPFELGALFAQDGASEQVHYADYASWTGASLPEPETCPTFNTFSICGAHCGGCNSGDVCTGRSPLHPYGVCLPTSSTECSTTGTAACEAGSSCFRFTVQTSAQGGADAHGVCLSTDQCQDMAANLPGGGSCQ